MLPDEIVAHMSMCIEITSDGYSCLRGPRPSGALIIEPEFNVPTFGFVVPSHNTMSCKAVGECMMEDGHCVRNLHAEVNAIIMAFRKGDSLEGGVIFSINKPCYNCTLHIILAGIKTIYYAYAVYDEERTTQALEAAGVECIHVPLD